MASVEQDWGYLAGKVRSWDFISARARYWNGEDVGELRGNPDGAIRFYAALTDKRAGRDLGWAANDPDPHVRAAYRLAKQSLASQ